jgi:uncharacterized protein (DUF1330 family)
MAKGYWIVAYRGIEDEAALAAYRELSGPAVAAAGGRFLVRGGRQETHEAGVDERTVLVEFDSYEAAVAAHATPAYQSALAALANGATRDFRIVEAT